MEKKLSLKDIAEQLGVSKTTVSFILNGKAKENHISESLAQRVLQHVKEVGYKPSQLARSLRTGETKIIGMLVEDISDPFFSSISRMIEEKAYNEGYKILYSSTENSTEKTKELIEVYRARQVDGYIIAPPPGVEKEIQALMKENLPVILFDRYFPDLKTTNVVVDNYESSYNACTLLLKNGYRHVGLITLSSEQIQMQERLLGYKQAMADQGRPPLVKMILYHNQPENTVAEIQQYLADNPSIDAVFFGTNYLADSGLEAIYKLKLKIPTDLGVIVFDDHTFFRLLSPSLTAISQPLQAISDAVIKLMLNRLTGKESKQEHTTTVLKTTLHLRESSVPIFVSSET